LNTIASYKEARKNAEYHEGLAATYENRLKDFVGDCAGMEGDWGKITWRKAKDSAITDWKSSYKALCEFAHDKGLIFNDDDFSGKFTTIKPGSRRWLPKFTKGD
jgi:hypothetical protein